MRHFTERLKEAMLLTLGWSFIAVSPLWAGEAPDALPTGPLFPSILRLVVTLVVVIALIYASVYAFKRMTTQRRGGGNQLLHIIEVLPLGAKTRLVAVRAGERVMLLGAGEDRVNLVAELEGTTEAEHLDEGDLSGTPFRERLLRLARK